MTPLLPVNAWFTSHVARQAFGVAKLRGQTARQRAMNLIRVAHPDFLRELTEAARKMNRI